MAFGGPINKSSSLAHDGGESIVVTAYDSRCGDAAALVMADAGAMHMQLATYNTTTGAG